MSVASKYFSRVLGMGLVMLVVAVPWSASAEPGAVGVAVLNMEGRDIDDGLLRTLTGVLRHEAQQREQYALVNPAPINLSEVVVVLGCDPDAVSCLRQAAEYLDARVLIYGEVERRAGRFYFTVEVFDSSTGEVLQQLARTVDGGADPVAAFRREVEDFFASQDVVPSSRLEVGSTVDGAEVRIEGMLVGRTPFERTGLDPGRYRVDVTASGYASWSVVVEVVEGGDLRLWAPLEKEGAKPGPQDVRPRAVAEAPVEPPFATSAAPGARPASGPRPRDPVTEPAESPRARSNWGAWSAIGVGAVALAGSGAMVVMMRDVEQEIADLSHLPRDEARTKYDELVARGQSYETGHRVLLGVGALSMTAGTVWLIVRKSQSRGYAETIEWSLGPGSVHGTLRF